MDVSRTLLDSQRNPTETFCTSLAVSCDISHCLHAGVFSYNASTCDSRGESWLDPQNYVGLNESRLCCRLVDKHNMSHVQFEECSQPLQLVPGKRERAYLINPLTAPVCKMSALKKRKLHAVLC